MYLDDSNRMLLYLMLILEKIITKNKTYLDEFGRVHGELHIDKPAGYTSHDIVDSARRYLNTKKIGHTGTLDPFATGLLILLIGKDLSRAESFLGMSKTYIASVLIGLGTDSGDLDGKIISKQENLDLINLECIDNAQKSLEPSYNQDVPVFSSVKVQGHKLREMARSADSFEIIVGSEGGDLGIAYSEDLKLIEKAKSKQGILNKFVVFKYKDRQQIKLPLPNRNVEIDIRVLSFNEILTAELIKRYQSMKKFLEQTNTNSDNQISILETDKFKILEIEVDCSKGTYIRQLAIDLGVEMGRMLNDNKLPMPAMLVGLRRSRIGEMKIDNS